MYVATVQKVITDNIKCNETGVTYCIYVYSHWPYVKDVWKQSVQPDGDSFCNSTRERRIHLIPPLVIAESDFLPNFYLEGNYPNLGGWGKALVLRICLLEVTVGPGFQTFHTLSWFPQFYVQRFGTFPRYFFFSPNSSLPCWKGFRILRKEDTSCVTFWIQI